MRPYIHPKPALEISAKGATAPREPLVVERSRWPEGHHLVCLQETLDLIPSEAFVAAVKRHELQAFGLKRSAFSRDRLNFSGGDIIKAFRLTWPETKSAMAADLGYKFQLPRLLCKECSPEFGSWGIGMFEFPSVRPTFLNVSDFSFRRLITLQEFKKLKVKIEKDQGRSVNLIPGACLGQISGVAHTAGLEDFIWGRVSVPQISARARDLLDREEIQLTTAPCEIRWGGKASSSHLAIQAEPAPMLTEGALLTSGIKHCSRCGHFVQPSPAFRVLAKRVHFQTRSLVLDKSKWPSGRHPVCLQETLDLIPSEAFIEAVKKHGLKGL